MGGCLPVLGFVIQGDGVLDDLSNRAFVLLGFDSERIERLLWETDGERGVFHFGFFADPSERPFRSSWIA